MIVKQPISEQLLRDFKPKKTWLLHDSLVHGVDHMARVFILQELICDRLEMQTTTVNRKALRWASSTHDARRIDDGVDLDHGRRSAQWIKDKLADQMTPEMLDIVTYLVHWHVPSDNEAPIMTTELQVLKDADALDRVRLGDLDIRYLRTDAARSMVDLAESLFVSYENIRSDDAFDSVIKAAQINGLVSRYE